MAFEDSLIGSDDFDPRAATESLIRQTAAEPLPETLDPRMLNTRLARKLAQPGPAPVPVDLEQPEVKAPAADFSGQAIEPTTPNAEADFSSQAAEPSIITPKAAPASNTGLSQYPIEFGKGVLEGGKNMGASALKGVAAVGIPTFADTALVDELGRVKDMTASQRAKLMGRVLREISDRGLQMDFNAALRRVSQGADAAQEMQALRSRFEANNKAATEPVKEKPLYKAGQAVEDFGKEALAPAPGFEPGKSWTRDIGSGAGSMAAGIAASMIPGIGPTLAGSLFTAAGMGEAAEKAVESGATNDQIRRATMLGGVAGATDLVDALLPMLGSTGKALGFLKRVGLAAVKGAIMEGGQEGVQQLMQNAIAKGIYKPDQDLFEDVPRSVAIAAILGGAGGGISGAATRDRAGGPGGGPSPDGGAAPGTGPTVDEFLREADAAREQAEGRARGAQTRSEIDEFLRQKEGPAVGLSAPSNADGSAAAEPTASVPQQEGLKPQAPASHLEYAVLREYGYSDEDISNMPATQRKREFKDAVAEGIEPGKAMSKHPKQAKPADQEESAAAPTPSAPESNGVQDQPPLDTGQNVPENRRTLKEQQNQLIKGERAVQMFPNGTREMPLPPGMERVETPRGVFHFNPKSYSADEIRADSAAGRENELLGLGPYSKQDIAARAGEPNVTIVERTADGTEVRAAVGTASTAPEQLAQMEKGKSPGNTVSIETPEQTLDGRRGTGKRDEPVVVRTARDVEALGNAASGDYTHAQGEANNRQLGHGKWNNLPISIEVAKGGTRKMVNPETGEGVDVTHAGAAYGYFLGTKGADGMHVDLYLGDNPESPTVYVIDEIDRDTGKFRQHKVMGGFASERDAFAAYVQTSTKGPETVGGITAMSVPEFKAWLSEGDTTRALKPASPGPDKTDEAGSAALTKPADGGSADTKETPDASLGGDGGVRSEATTPPDRGGSSAPAKKAVDEPLSLLQFIANRGGLAPNGELNALGLAGDYRVQIPGRKGFFGLVKATGESLDNMREAAEEAGYFRGEQDKTSTIRDFLDAIDVELRGGQHRAEGEEAKPSKRERTSQAESSAAARDKAIAENVDAIKAEYVMLPEGLAEQAATIMADEMLDIDTAVETAALRSINDDPDYEVSENDITATYGEGAFDALQSRAASENGADTAPGLEEKPRSGEGQEASADGAPDEGAGAQGSEAEINDFIYGIERSIRADNMDADISPTRSMADFRKVAESRGWTYGAYGKGKALWSPDRKHVIFPSVSVEGNHVVAQWSTPGEGTTPPDTERTEAGQQMVLPGAERIGQGEQAQRAADRGLKPKKPQQALDEGLFGDDAAQADFISGYTPSQMRSLLNDEQEQIVNMWHTVNEPTPAGASEHFKSTKAAMRRELAKEGYDRAQTEDELRDMLLDTRLSGQMVKPTLPETIDQIEAALGVDADKVAPVDITRAAEIMTEQPGIDVGAAFGQAVIENAVEQGFLTEQEAIEAYGEEVKPTLEAAAAGAYQRGGDLEPEGVNVGELGSAAEAGELPRRGEDRRAEADNEQLDDTTGTKPNAEREAGSETAEEGTSATQDPEQWWDNQLTRAGRKDILEQAGLTKPDRVRWRYLSADEQSRIADFMGASDGQEGASADLRQPQARNARDAGVDSLGLDEAAVPGSEAGAGVLRGGDGLSGVAGQLPGVLRRPGTEAGTGLLDRAPAGQRGVSPGQLRVGDKDGAVSESARLRDSADLSGQDATRRGVGGRAGDQGENTLPATADRLVGGENTRDAATNVGGDRGVQGELYAGDAPASPEAVQPVEPGGDAASLRGREGSGSEPAVPRADGERAEGAGRVSEGAGGERSDRAGDGGDARLSGERADDAADGRAERAPRRAADVSDAEDFAQTYAGLTPEGLATLPPIYTAEEWAEQQAREQAAMTRPPKSREIWEPGTKLSKFKKDRAEKRAADAVEGENFVIEPGALGEERGFRAKAYANVRAIELANKITAEGRPATAAEQNELALYVGWGGIKNAFPDSNGEYGTGFGDIGRKLQEVLTPDEYATARRSIQYAHYTAEDVVRSMWSAVEKMGFTGGQVFEPGMGVGNFAGMMPADIAAKTSYAGIELDHVTARIAKLLYPKWGVRQDDFTKTKLPENNYDLVIGNPPFADVAIKSDPKYKQGFLLHDYFFAKSLDAVRPGGLLAFVTSAGTMNKLDTAAREYLADRADLVGAIRLPGDAFLKNAGTAVTTDIIFLRKRLPGDVPGDRTWTETKVVSLPGMEGQLVEGNVNRYFAEHPEMVLGKPDFNDRLYPGRYSVKSVSGSDLKTDLARAIEKLPEGIMSDWQGQNADQHAQDFETAEKKEGTYYLGPNGNLFQVVDGVGREVGQRGKGVENGRTAADMERIRGLVPVRDALRAVYAADMKGDTGNAERARAQLNAAYDAFVEKHGPINKAVIQTRRPNVIQMEAARAEAREEARYNGLPFREGTFDARKMIEDGIANSVIARERQAARDAAQKAGIPFDEGDFDPDEVPDIIIDKRPNVDPFMDDPESYRLRAIEHYDEGTGKGHKSDVFFKNVISREVTPKISSVNDALLYSLSQYGRVNVPAMAELMKKTEAEIVAGLGEQVYKVPGTKDTYQTRDEYLSGNVRKKLELAQKAADRNPDFRRNVAALEAAQPMPLAPSQIHASLGMPWIPQAEIEQFALKELGLEKIRVRYTPKLASWHVSGDTDSVAASTTWGTVDRRAPALIEDALNRRNPKIYDQIINPDGRKSQVLNVGKTEAATDKMNAIREKFGEWFWSDQERADRMAAYYNEKYNNLVVRQYDGEYLTTPGIASTWSWRPHQKRVIARIIQSGNTYVAHAVGAGKTSEYIGAIMEMRRLGLVRKPMVSVPNHMLAQFTKEWYEQYPTARLAIADDKRFHTDRRKQFIANVANDDLDAIIITHSSFGMIPVSDKFQNAIIEREIAQYREVLADIKKEGGDTRITRSRVEKQIERLEQRLVSKKGRKDSVFTFEEMGVDHLTIDEAHLFRKLDFTTTMSNLKGVSPEGSGMAWDLYVKSLYLDTIRPGRGLVLGSGTPVTNTMAELYTVSRFMQPAELAERGLEKFDAWAGAFGESVSELEQDAAGNYKPVSRFAKFVNVAELSAMVRQVMDVVTSKQLEQYVTRPQIKGGKREMILAEKSRALVRYQESLAERMQAIQARKGPPQKGDDIMLSVINDGRHAAIDMRLADGEQSEIPSKLELMVDNVYRIWEESKRQKFYKVAKGGGYETKPAMTGPATQLIFANLGLSGARGFSVPDYIRHELIRRGVPKDEIAYIYDYKNATAKQRLFNDMNEGKKRILLGSVAKMGVGTNVQRRLLATHNLDPLWYPADDEQRNGRIIRQGNMNPEVAIYDYSTKGTYDSTMWGMMAKKARFIEGFFEGDPSLRDMEDLGESSQYEQAKALTTNDPRLIRFTELKQELEKAQRRKSAFDNEVYNTRQRRARAATEIEHYTARVAETQQDIKQRINTKGDAFKGTVLVGKKATEFDNRVDFADALYQRIEELEESGTIQPIKVAEVGGFPIYVTSRRSNLLKNETMTDVFMQLNGPSRNREVSFEASALGTVRSIEHVLSGLESDLVEYRQRLDKAQKFYDDSAEKAVAKFQGDAEIAELAKQVKDMEAALASDNKPVAPTDEAPDLAQLSDMSATLTPAAEAQRAELERLLTSIVRAIAGNVPKVEFHNGLIPLDTVHGYPEGMRPVAAGVYRLGTALLRLALTQNAEQMQISAFHESYHHVEDRLQTQAERELMKAETPRLREYIKGKTAMTDAQVDGLAGYEVRAIAFQTYAAERVANARGAGKGVHVGVRRWFERLLELLTRIRNGLKGLGFKTYKDVFAETYEGKVAAREDRGSGGIDPVDMAALADIYDAVATRIESKFGEGVTELRTQIQDKFIRVKQLEQSLGNRSSARSAYQAESLYYGRTGEQLEKLEKEHFDPLIEDMAERRITLPQINDYLYAKHAPERNARMDEINHPELDPGGRDLRGRGSGMSDEEAAQIMADITRLGRMADFEAIEARVRTIIDDTRQYLVESGLISQENADAWANQYQYYVPLRGFDEATEDDSFTGKGQGFDTRARESQQALGRLSKAAGPLPYVMMQAETAIVRGEKNRVGNTALRLLRSNPDPTRWEINTAKTKKAIDPRTGLVTTVTDHAPDPNEFITKVGGQRMVIRFKGKEGANLARAFKNMGTSNLNGVLRLFHNVTTAMSRLATQWNPNFTLPNFPRDVGEAFINLQAQDQQRFVKQFSKHLFPAIKGSFDALRGATGGRYAAAFREFDEAGGRIRFFGLENHEDVKKNVSNKLRRLEGGVWNSFRDAGEAAAHGFDIVNGSIENATRLAAYMAARDVGMTKPDAAMLARNLTVDFNKKGELGTAINALYMFANASIQGTVRIGTALTHKRVRRAAYALVTIGALSAMAAAMGGDDDDAGENYYAKVPHWIRDKNLIIMWPKGWGNDGKYIKIPLPYGFAPFFVLGQRIAMVAMGKDKPAEAAYRVLASIGDAMNPLGEDSSIFSSILPSVFRPGEHIQTNKNWTGNPLYPENQWEKHKPDSEQSFRSTSAFSKEAARQINAATGGSPYKPGWLDWHPGSIDHVLETLTGGLGKFIGDVVKTGGAFATGEPFDATKAPILRRFYGTSNSPETDQQAYYRAREEARKNGGEAIKDARKDRGKGVNVDAADSFLRSNTNSARGEQIFKTADEAMKPLRQRRDRIEADKQMEPEAKRGAMKELEAQMRIIQNRARKQYIELRGAQ